MPSPAVNTDEEQFFVPWKSGGALLLESLFRPSLRPSFGFFFEGTAFGPTALRRDNRRIWASFEQEVQLGVVLFSFKPP